MPRIAEYLTMFCIRVLSLLLFLVVLPPLALSHVGFDDEIDALTVRIEAEPGNAELYWLRGDVNRIYAHWDRALSDFESAQRLDVDLYKADLGIGRTYYDQGRYRKAITHLNRFLTREPGNIRGLQTRARARTQLGQYSQAATDYTLAIEQFQPPKKPTPVFYLERARAQAAVGSLDDAVEGLDAGLQVLGPIITLELYAVELQTESGYYDAALPRLDRIIKRSARKDAYLVKRSEILMQAGRSAEARQDLRSALAALDGLPGSRRNTRASKHMRVRIHDHLNELDR